MRKDKALVDFYERGAIRSFGFKPITSFMRIGRVEIDLVCVDENGSFVVVEVKSGKAGVDAIRQAMEYRDVFERFMGEKTRAVVIAHDFSRYAKEIAETNGITLLKHLPGASRFLRKKITISLPLELYNEFTSFVKARYGTAHYHISEAVCEAVELWLQRERRNFITPDPPRELLPRIYDLSRKLGCSEEVFIRWALWAFTNIMERLDEVLLHVDDPAWFLALFEPFLSTVVKGKLIEKKMGVVKRAAP